MKSKIELYLWIKGRNFSRKINIAIFKRKKIIKNRVGFVDESQSLEETKDRSQKDSMRSFFREIHFPKNDMRFMNRKCWQKGRVFGGR